MLVHARNQFFLVASMRWNIIVKKTLSYKTKCGKKCHVNFVDRVEDALVSSTVRYHSAGCCSKTRIFFGLFPFTCDGGTISFVAGSVNFSKNFVT